MVHSDNALFWAREFPRLFPFPAALQASPLDTTMPQQQQVTKPFQEGVFLKVKSRKKFKRRRKQKPTDLDLDLDLEISWLSFPTVPTLPPWPKLARPLNKAMIDLTWSEDEEKNRTEIEYWSLISFLLTFQVKTNILPTKPFLFLPMKTCLHLCLQLMKNYPQN